jgi:succinate-acetate transporter protein
MATPQSSVTDTSGTQQAPPMPTVQEIIVARDIKIADPGPLGLGAFALTTFLLSMFNAELVRGSGLPVVFGVALMYGGIAQVLAGMWEFRAGNTFGATAFTSYGAFWLSYWALVHFYVADIIKAGAAGKAVGLYLIAWGIFSLYMFIATFRINVGLVVVFGLLVITFALLGIGQAGAHANVHKWGGYFGLATAAAAWYCSFAGVLNSTFDRTVLPLKPLK